MNRIQQILLLPILFCVLLVAAISAKAQSKQYDFIVAKDGSGNFKTVQEAINAVSELRKKTTTIFIKNGIYKEKLTLAANKTMVKFIGENAEKL